jgi:hypothetical protein
VGGVLAALVVLAMVAYVLKPLLADPYGYAATTGTRWSRSAIW